MRVGEYSTFFYRTFYLTEIIKKFLKVVGVTSLRGGRSDCQRLFCSKKIFPIRFVQKNNDNFSVSHAPESALGLCSGVDSCSHGVPSSDAVL